MGVLASLVVKLTGDISEYEAAMSRAEKKAEGFKRVGASLTSAGKTLTAGLTLPIVGLGAVAVNAASDLDESMNKVQVVFGDSADSVIGYSENASTALGQSQQQALEAAGTYGNLLTSLGLSTDASAEMSTTMVTLASDLASFNNASPEETLLALRSALTGETEPMKRFGVALNQAAIASKATELGLVGVDGVLTPAAKAQATYALILESTTNAQGDFARTSDGLANATRIAKAQFIDAAAAIGQQLLPYALQIVQVINQWLSRFQGLSPEMQKTIVIVLGIAAAIGPLLIIVGSLISAIGAIIPVVTAVVGVLSGPLLLVIGLVIGIVALLAAAWKNNWGDIQGKTQAAIAWIQGAISKFIATIQAWWTAHGDQVIATAQKLWDGVMQIFDFFKSQFETLYQAFRAAFEGDWTTFGEKLRELWDNAWEAIKTVVSKAWDWFKEVVPKIIDNIVEFFQSVDWGQVGEDIIKGIANGISSAVSWIIKAVQGVGAAAIKAIKGFLGISSPSRVMIPIGQNITRGIALGASDPRPLQAALTNAISAAISPSGLQPQSTRPSIIMYGVSFPSVNNSESFLETFGDLMT